MSPAKLRTSGVQGIGLIAVTYVYFLIFAQFAFLHRLDALGIAGASLEVRNGCDGHRRHSAQSSCSARCTVLPSSVRRLQLALCLAGIAAFLIARPLTASSAIAVSLLIGAGSACSLSPLSHTFANGPAISNASVKVGLGTGIGYLRLQRSIALHRVARKSNQQPPGLLCLSGNRLRELHRRTPHRSFQSRREHLRRSTFHSLSSLPRFAALIWLDSAAFFIIQNTTVSKPAHGKAPPISGQTVSSISVPLCSAHSSSAAAVCPSFWLPL